MLYTTEELLDLFDARLSAKLKLTKSNKKVKKLTNPPVIKTFNKKTYIQNFELICNEMMRDPLNVQQFIENELKTKSSINEDNMLILNNVYNENQIKQIITKYMKKYVFCLEPKCNSSNTTLLKENRIVYMQCNTCQSKKPLE